MTTTLSEGVKVPDVGSVNWAGDLEVNWNLLNGALANLSGNVKLDRDNTWTGEQSFTLPIVGSIAGTASKAIADEDGTSIKSGYVNVAGNQTVSGDKSFTGSNTFNNILPNSTNTYSLGSSSYQWSSVYAQTYYYNGTQWGLDKDNVWSGINIFTDVITYKDTVAEIGNYPASNRIKYQTFADKNGTTLGYANFAVATNGVTSWNLWLENKATNGVLSPTGTQVKSFMGLYIDTDMSSKLKLYGDFIPNNTSRFDLGTSTNQWSSVYAQTYYYNGTAWGLDKANVWTGSNRFRNFGVQSANTIDITQSTYANSQNCGGIGFSDAVNRFWGDIELNVKTDATSEMVFNLSNWRANGAQGVTALRFRYDKTLTTVDFFGADRVVNLGTSTNKWKTLNGVNPGALSLPDNSNAINLDTTNWGVSGELNHYAPTINGWLCISVKGGANNGLFLMDTSSGFGQSCYGNANETVAGRIKVALPVIASRDVLIIIHADSNSDIYEAKLYPCLGNV